MKRKTLQKKASSFVISSRGATADIFASLWPSGFWEMTA
jgi:hypothetical protein